jgi:hypothetical protein
VRSYAPPLSPFPQATAHLLALIHPPFMAIMATIMLVITLMIVTGSAKAVSVRCAVHLGYRAGAKRTVHEPVL